MARVEKHQEARGVWQCQRGNKEDRYKEGSRSRISWERFVVVCAKSIELKKVNLFSSLYNLLFLSAPNHPPKKKSRSFPCVFNIMKLGREVLDNALSSLLVATKNAFIVTLEPNLSLSLSGISGMKRPKRSVGAIGEGRLIFNHILLSSIILMKNDQ